MTEIKRGAMEIGQDNLSHKLTGEHLSQNFVASLTKLSTHMANTHQTLSRIA